MGIAAPATKRPWWRRARFAILRAVRSVLLLTDTPHRIALGSAAGLFIMPLPIPGQFVLGPLIARLLHGNVLASIPWTWVNNPVTFLFFNYAQYRLGFLLLPSGREPLSFSGLSELFTRFQHLPWSEALNHGLDVLGDIVLPLAIGSLMVAVVCAVLGYPLVHRLVTLAQRKKQARYAQWRRSGPSDGHGVDTPGRT
jgi:uncharacterized protein (DUF2062 family)